MPEDLSKVTDHELWNRLTRHILIRHETGADWKAYEAPCPPQTEVSAPLLSMAAKPSFR